MIQTKLAARAGNRRRILISPIGKSDPYTEQAPDAEGPAVSICRAVQPDVLYLVPSANRPDVRSHTMREAEQTREYLAHVEGLVPDDRIYVKPLDVRDVTDYSEVLAALERIVRGIREETGAMGPCYFFLNGSSGTPQIQTAATLLVATGAIAPATVVQAADPRMQTRVERVVAVDVGFAVERQRADEALRLFDRSVFQGAAQLLERLAEEASALDRRTVAGAGASLARSYAALEEMSYAAAADWLDKALAIARGTAEFAPVAPLLEAQRETLAKHQARQGHEDASFLVDVYHSADRRRAAGLYADALARAWRLLEGGLHFYLRDRFEIEPTALHRSADLPRATQVAQRSHSGRDLRDVSLRVSEWHAALETELQDTAFAGYLRQTYALDGRRVVVRQEWDAVRQIRNDSVVAHGVRPVSRDEADRAMALCRGFLAFLRQEDLRTAYPFRRDALRQVSSTLRRSLCG